MRKWFVRLVGLVLLVVTTLVIGGGVQAVMGLPDLQAWHHFAPDAELRASDMDDAFTLPQYLDREATVFAQVRDNVEAPTIATAGAIVVGSRYDPGSMSSPRHADRDWNRTFEMAPADVRGGVLLVHGLTDSPYSMRAIATLLSAKGFYALALRMPGHGTVPAGAGTRAGRGLAGRRPDGRAPRAAHDRARSPADARRILQRRRAGDALRARSHP